MPRGNRRARAWSSTSGAEAHQTSCRTGRYVSARTAFRFRHAPEKKRYFWLVLPEVDLCRTDPGFGVDLTVRTDPRTLARVWIGDVGLAGALRRRDIELEGPEHLVRDFPKWFGLNPFASVERPRGSPAARHR